MAKRPRPAAPPPEPVPQTDPEHIARFEKEVLATVNSYVRQLKQSILYPDNLKDSRKGVFGNLKRWWSDVWHGRYNQQNPYFRNNAKDDIAHAWMGESSEGLSLHEFKMLREMASLLEGQWESDNPLDHPANNMKLFGMIDKWGQNLSQKIIDLFKQSLAQYKPATPQKPQVDFSVLGNNQPPQTPATPAAPTPAPAPSAPAPSGSTGPVTPTPDPANAAPAAAPSSDYQQRGPFEAKPGDINKNTPPVKNWHELSHLEQSKWNEYGGGETKDVTYSMRKAGVRSLPWILRKDDPRIPIIKSIKAGQDHKWKRLVTTKRVEGENGVQIDDNDPGSLQQAVAAAKQLAAEESKKFLARHAPQPQAAPQKPEPKPEPSGLPKQQSLFGDEEPAKEEPAKSNVDKIREKIQQHADAGTIHSDFIDTLNSMLDDGEVEEVERYLQQHESYSFNDYLMSLPLRERTECYRRSLRGQDWKNHTTMPNKRKARELPLPERVSYYKKLLSSRDVS